MRRGFYSASPLSRRPAAAKNPVAIEPLPQADKPTVVESRKPTWRSRYKRHEKPILFIAGAALAVTLVAIHSVLTPEARPITQNDIDEAVARPLETKPLPSPAVKAYQAVRSSIVRVRATGHPSADGVALEETPRRASGSGVVIIDRGVILTNLHVVAGASV